MLILILAMTCQDLLPKADTNICCFHMGCLRFLQAILIVKIGQVTHHVYLFARFQSYVADIKMSVP